MIYVKKIFLFVSLTFVFLLGILHVVSAQDASLVEVENYECSGTTYPTCTYSLTTVAGQRVVIIAKGNTFASGGISDTDIYLKYNGSTVDHILAEGISSANTEVFSLIHTFVATTTTANVVVESNSQDMNDIKIIIMKYTDYVATGGGSVPDGYYEGIYWFIGGAFFLVVMFGLMFYFKRRI